MQNYNVNSKEPNVLWTSSSKIEDRIDANPYKVEFIEKEKILEKNMKTTTISELLRNKKDLTGGATPLGANYLIEGIRFIRTQNIQRNTIDLSDVVYISYEDNNKLSRSKLEEDDVLLTITGADFGRIAPVSKNYLPANINQHSVRMHFKENMDPYFISTYLNSSYGQSQIFKYSIGVTRPAIDYTSIKKIKIPIPSSIIQKYIGDKVRRAEELRDDAKKLKTICEDTIVNEIKQTTCLNNVSFEEHAGKLNANEKYKNKNSVFVTTKFISDRIDPKFFHLEHVDTIKKISETEHYLLKDVILNYDTGVSQLQYSENGVPVISTGNLNNYIISKPEKYTISTISKSKYLKQDDILITTYGATSIGKIDIYDKTTNATFDYTLFRPKFKDDYPAYYMCLMLRTNLIQKQIKYSINSGGGTNFVNNSSLLEIKIPKLETGVMNELNELMKESISKIRLSEQLIEQAKQDVEDLIEGNFDMSKLNDATTESR